MSERNIEIVREYNFDPKEVIAGLNGYYESDKRNGYITVRRNDVEGPAYLSTTIYLSSLIEWLRVDHDIFYYPGMDIRDLREAGMEATKEDVWKNVMNCIRQEPSQNGFDLPRACQDLIEDLKKREVEIKELKERIAELESNFKAVCDEGDIFRTRALKAEEEAKKLKKEIENLTESNCKDIMSYIRQEASRNGFELPEKIDGEPLSIKRIFHDLLELLMKRAKEIREVNDKRWKDLRDINKALGYDGMNGHVDDFAKAVKARAECTNRALGEESDINKLIRDYCAKHDITAPSRYFSDKACVEYLFSVVDLEQKKNTARLLESRWLTITKRIS